MSWHYLDELLHNISSNLSGFHGKRPLTYMIFGKTKKDSKTPISLFIGEIFLILIKVLLIIVNYLLMTSVG